MNTPLRVVIIGGGTSGYMCAAALTGAIKPGLCDVRLIESEDIGTVGVGEATLPHVRDFNRFVGIDEAEFMRMTQATIKLGIEFVDWGKKGNSYIHPFGAFGHNWAGIEFHHHWLRAKQHGLGPGSLEDYSFAIAAARARRFDFPSEDLKTVQSTYSYAYHFDAGLYAAYLRGFAEARGLLRTEGRVVDVTLDATSGDIATVTLASGETVEGDLFIDCSGFRALLIGQALNVGWEDWSPWLPCDRAMAVPCARSEDFTPFTRSTALEAGWQWRIPLQHRTGNGYVYASRFISDEAAAERLLGNLDGPALADPKLLRFQAGRRVKSWYRNCLTIGLSCGFLEPLESTSIYLAQISIMTLIQRLPTLPIDPRLSDEFNRVIDMEYERVRDFLILHYHAQTREDGELWRYTRDMPVPDSLVWRTAQFRHRGHIRRYKDGLFSPDSWLAVFVGQDIEAGHHNRMAEVIDLVSLEQKLGEL
ncbi:MAG: tryptophan 7-halogenase [Asticcacaulis sp.]|nr:tryptophan 7-halogenase [Asticcacaulis sp.]